MQTFRTHEIAKIIGVHPNTVRMYESIGFISTPERSLNGYRIYTQLHVNQMKLARTALRAEVLQNGLRKKAIEIIQLCAAYKFDKAIKETEKYDSMLVGEIDNAKLAIKYVETILQGGQRHETILLKRSEAASLLCVTTDTLRNWEVNGLVTIKRKQNGYRVYDGEDIERLQIIRSLRCANYSLASILRLLQKLSGDDKVVIEDVLNTPENNETIVSVCDRLIISLEMTRQDVVKMSLLLQEMRAQI